MPHKLTQKRVNIRVGLPLIQWYEEEAEKLGIATNALIVMAMKEYMKQETAINTIPQVLEQVRRSASVSGA